MIYATVEKPTCSRREKNHERDAIQTTGEDRDTGL
jgi:hypothetical protein